MNIERDIKRRYQHPDAVSYTPENKGGLMLLIKPSFSFENRRHIYFVAAHKLILNVSKIRLRLICARALYLYRLFSKALDMAYLLRCLDVIFFKQPYQRIVDCLCEYQYMNVLFFFLYIFFPVLQGPSF